MIFSEILLMEGLPEQKEALYNAVKSAVEFPINAEGLKCDAELCIAFASDEQIRELNSEYRGIDKPTDVLSFPANDLSRPMSHAIDAGLQPETSETGAYYLGDIVISLDTAARQAEELGNTFTEEMCFLAVHGTLHLLGYDHIDPADEEIMLKKQREARSARNGGRNDI